MKENKRVESNDVTRANLRLVRFSPRKMRVEGAYPFRKGAVMLLLGEIRNMPGHCAVVDLDSGRIHVGYHCESFTEIPIDET